MRIINFDICAIVLALTVLLYLVIRRYTKGRTNRLILLIAALVIISGLLDVYDSLFGTYVEQLPSNATVQFVSNTFFYLIRNLTTPAYLLFLYSYFGVWYLLKNKGIHFWVVVVPYTVMTIGMIVNCFHPLIFYVDAGGVYHRGPAIVIIYVIAAIYLTVIFSITIHYRNTVRKAEFLMLLSFGVFNMIAVIAQRIKPEMRVEVLALALTIFMTATAIQRPEEVVDAVVGTLSQNGFFIDMRRAYAVGRPTNLLLVKITNHRALRLNLGLEIYNAALQRTGAKFIQMGKIINLYTDVYYNGRGVFAIVTEADKYDQTLDMGRLVVSYMKESFTINNLEIRLDAKVCLARTPNDIQSYSSLMSFVNMFHRTIPPMDKIIILSEILDSQDYRMKSEIDNIIKRGIEENSFRMFYQPIYSVKDDKFVSGEALIRLFDEEYGYISPALFIPAAENSGAIHDIGDFVLEDVIRFIRRGDFAGSGLKYIEINLSVAQCIEPGLTDKIKGLADKYSVKPSQINLEITETAADYDPKITDENIFRLWNMGYKFSLDDYGTGYSNIKRVVSLPFDIVKFDKSFVDEMDDPKMWIAIVNTVNMLKRMNKKILVEGVEDKRTLDRFIDLGCDYIQGFYFSKPLEQAEFIKFVNEHNSGRVSHL
ncbi:MAG: EAL domain-containing protein [Lachnospiraceae bacterium]|nr:EAL domain-containing protein [Lachnospiraceae bacterium]